MEVILNDSFKAAQVKEKTLDFTPRTLDQIKALLNAIKLGDLLFSLFKKKSSSIQVQLLNRLNIISKRLPEKTIALFFIDPQKYMQKESDYAWAQLIKTLPGKIKFVFAQRPDDVLITSDVFMSLPNVLCIPKGLPLDRLSVEDTRQLISIRATKTGYLLSNIESRLSHYEGHPYALQAALDLLESGVSLDELPLEPTGIAEAQWKKICQINPDAISLFEAYALQSKAESDEIIKHATNLDINVIKSLRANDYLKGLLEEQGDCYKIYHAILADYITRQIDEEKQQHWHVKIIDAYVVQSCKRGSCSGSTISKICEHLSMLGGALGKAQESIKTLLTTYNHSSMYLIYRSWLNAGGELDFVWGGIHSWLSLHKNLPEARFVYEPWLNAGGKLDFVQDDIHSWLSLHEDIPEAEFVYNSWLNAGGDIEFVSSSLESWLSLHKDLPEAQFVYNSWLNAGGELDFVRDGIHSWLSLHKNLPEAQFVYNSWLNAGGELDFVRDGIQSWLSLHKDIPEARFVYKPWLNAGGELDFVRDDIHSWLSLHKDIPEAQFVYNSWLNAGGELDFVRDGIKSWLSIHKNIPKAQFVYKPWLDAGGELEFVRDGIKSWLLLYKDLPEASFVYEPWLDAGGELDFVRDGIKSWLSLHKDIPEARFVYNSWLNAGGDIKFVSSSLESWLEVNKDTPEAQSLIERYRDEV
jgi:hypothetical protein